LDQYIVVQSNPDIVRHWAQIRTARRRQPISVSDAWIAATALAFNVELITHNPADFRGVPNLQIISESP